MQRALQVLGPQTGAPPQSPSRPGTANSRTGGAAGSPRRPPSALGGGRRPGSALPVQLGRGGNGARASPADEGGSPAKLSTGGDGAEPTSAAAPTPSPAQQLASLLQEHALIKLLPLVSFSTHMITDMRFTTCRQLHVVALALFYLLLYFPSFCCTAVLFYLLLFSYTVA